MTDTTIIDVVLGTYLSVKSKSQADRLWLFIIGKSGDGKTELIRPLLNREDVITVGRITRAGLMSANSNTDLYTELKDGEPHLILIPDMAPIICSHNDTKAGIFADLRLWYDGMLLNRNAYAKQNANINIGFLACITPQVRNDKAIFSANNIGTHELFYGTTRADFKTTCLQIKKNNGQEEKMRNHIAKAYNTFLKDKEFNHYKPDDHLTDFMINKAEEIAIYRASGSLDYKGHNYTEIEMEHATRCYKGLSTIYSALRSLESNYPVPRFEKIINNIVRNAGNIQRYKIVQFLIKYSDLSYNCSDITETLRLNRHIVARELDGLFLLNVLNREHKEEHVGGIWQKVYYYWLNDNKKWFFNQQ
jgi:hypothetical protein